MSALGIGVCTQDTTVVWGGTHKNGRSYLVGQKKPRYLTEAIIAVDKAWREYDEMVDRREDHLAVNMEVEAAAKKAKLAEDHYHEEYAKWQQSLMS